MASLKWPVLEKMIDHLKEWVGRDTNSSGQDMDYDYLHILHIESDYQETEWKETVLDGITECALPIEWIDMIHEWNASHTFEQFIQYDVSSLFRKPYRVVYLHPLSHLYDSRHAQWMQWEKSVQTGRLVRYAQQFRFLFLLVVPHDELSLISNLLPHFKLWNLPSVSVQSQWEQTTTGFDQGHHVGFLLQWSHLSQEELAQLFVQHPLLWNHHHTSTLFQHVSFVRSVWALWIPRLLHWTAKDFIRREAVLQSTHGLLHFVHLFGSQLNESPEFDVQKKMAIEHTIQTIKWWASNRRHCQLTFPWFRQHVRPEWNMTKSRMSIVWKNKANWEASDVQKWFNPLTLLQISDWSSSLSSLPLPHDPLWRHSRSASFSASHVMNDVTWFAYLQRLS